MTKERPTVRPVNLGRLVEVVHLCEQHPCLTEDVADSLNVTQRRARETILESERISLIEQEEGDNTPYSATAVGCEFLTAVKNEYWSKINEILAVRSPHYSAFLELFEERTSIDPDTALEQLTENSEFTPYEYNQTSLDVIGGWAQRLGSVQRNAFTGTFYAVDSNTIPPNFPYIFLSVVDEVEEQAGVNLKQRYLSIPELREHVCERLNCERESFDRALVSLSEQNIGRLELSGAPIDTGAKDARFGLKTIDLSSNDGLVSTNQSSEQVMRGVEQGGKQYYYLAVFDRDLQFENNEY